MHPYVSFVLIAYIDNNDDIGLLLLCCEPDCVMCIMYHCIECDNKEISLSQICIWNTWYLYGSTVASHAFFSFEFDYQKQRKRLS